MMYTSASISRRLVVVLLNAVRLFWSAQTRANDADGWAKQKDVTIHCAKKTKQQVDYARENDPVTAGKPTHSFILLTKCTTVCV